jgi:hypothetical protein
MRVDCAAYACLWLAPVMPFIAAAGDAACVTCHTAQTAHFRATPMAQALETVAVSDILKQHPDLAFQEGPYQSRIVRQGDRSILTVTRGAETFTVPLLWAFGRGQAGQTYVFEYNGAFYESRASFFYALGALDVTMGDQNTKPQTIVEAAGRHMSSMEARDCFGCHSNGGVSEGKLRMEAINPGVGCESCHVAAEKHAGAVRAGDTTAAKLPRLGALSAEDMAALCGRCHRTWSQIALTGPRGVNNVRFQPYRLANSKCFDGADSRIRCTACHNPHEPLETNLAGYDAQCAACHATALHTTVCPVAKTNCAGCHMPKVELPGAHARFTDHQIRIARAGDPYPN